MKHHHELFNDKPEIYLQSRPRYPAALFSYLSDLCENHGHVWDAACGNGQAAIDLAEYFDEVKASDISEQQIKNAIPHAKVEYSIQACEATSFPENYFDLVCVAQALHWFDYDTFWPEVERVLKPGGIFAAWGYSWLNIQSDINQIIKQEILMPIQPYWAEQNQLLWDHYRNIPFPFTQQAVPAMDLVMHWNMDELFNYIHSWSATRRCMEAIGDVFFIEAYHKVTDVWGPKEGKRRIGMDFFVLAGRNSAI